MESGLLADLPVVVLGGALGGLALGLMQERGLELPSVHRENNRSFYDLGFIADIIIGILAAVIVYGFNPPSTSSQLLSTSIISGVGGSGILKSYVKSTGIMKHAEIAKKYKDLADRAAKGEDSSVLSSKLKEVEKEEMSVKRRWRVD